MLPQKNCEDSVRDLAERQSNYLILSSLEQKLPPELFRRILTEVSVHKSLTLSDIGDHEPAKSTDLVGNQKWVDLLRPQNGLGPPERRFSDLHAAGGGWIIKTERCEGILNLEHPKHTKTSQVS